MNPCQKLRGGKSLKSFVIGKKPAKKKRKELKARKKVEKNKGIEFKKSWRNTKYPTEWEF